MTCAWYKKVHAAEGSHDQLDQFRCQPAVVQVDFAGGDAHDCLADELGGLHAPPFGRLEHRIPLIFGEPYGALDARVSHHRYHGVGAVGCHVDAGEVLLRKEINRRVESHEGLEPQCKARRGAEYSAPTAVELCAAMADTTFETVEDALA